MISGERGSGRRTVAKALSARRVDPAETRAFDADVVGAGRPYAALEALELIDESSIGSTPDAIARKIAGRVRPTTFVIENAEYVDAMSLRTLAILARRSQDVRMILTIDSEAVALRGWRDVHGLPLVSVERLTPETVSDLVERAVGARPAVVDAHLLHQLGAGSFRATRWLIDLARLNGGELIDHGRARVRIPDVLATVDVPSWSIDPELIDDDAARLVALACGLPLTVLESLGIVDKCLEWERQGILRTVDRTVDFAIPALAYDISARMGPIERRRGIGTLLAVLDPDEATPASARVFWHHAVDVDIAPREVLTARAIREASARGHHTEVLRMSAHLASPFGDSVARAAFAGVMEGDDEAGVNPATLEATPDVAEAVAVAYAVGEFRYGPQSESARRFDALVPMAGPDGALVLKALSTLMRPGPRLDEREVTRVCRDERVPPHTRARGLRVLGLTTWLDGRPVRAAELNLEADELDAGSAADTAISLFLRTASAVLRPDVDGAAQALLEGMRPGDTSHLRALLGAMLGLYSGATPIARMHLETLTTGGSRRDAVLDPITFAMLSIAHSMLGDDERAQAALEASYDAPSASDFVMVGALHLRGIAVTQLAQPDPDEGLSLYSAAADGAEQLGFRLLAGFARYRSAMTLDERHRASALRQLSTLRDGDRPLDGVPEMLADLADALTARDIRALISTISRLREAGLLQDAKVVATRVLSSTVLELPARLRRQIARIANQRIDGAATTKPSVLTSREQEVAVLLPEGLTDRAIADQLGCSHRTVSVHVGHILRKLNIPSRRDIDTPLLRMHGVPV